MRFVTMSILMSLPSLGFAAVTTCKSKEGHQPAYTVTAQPADGVFQGFYAVQIERSGAKILALGQPSNGDEGIRIPFWQVNENGELRMQTGEYLDIGAHAELSLQDDKSVPLSCTTK